jgi:hypothetical protein
MTPLFPSFIEHWSEFHTVKISHQNSSAKKGNLLYLVNCFWSQFWSDLFWKPFYQTTIIIIIMVVSLYCVSHIMLFQITVSELSHLNSPRMLMFHFLHFPIYLSMSCIVISNDYSNQSTYQWIKITCLFLMSLLRL